MKKFFYIFLLSTCTLVACTCGSAEKASTVGEVPSDTVPYYYIPLYYNNDSLMYYAKRAYLDDDPAALCITGAAAYLHFEDTAALDTLSIVPLDEAAIMLIRSCELGFDDACRMIQYLELVGLWDHSIPE